MIDDSKSRQPGDAVFATFKIPYEKWQHFQHAAQLEGKTASATLVAFIEQYLSQEKTSLSSKAPTAELPSLEQLEMTIKQILEKRLGQAALPQVTHLEEKLDRLELVLRKFDERLGKVETAISQWKSQQYQPPDLVDVEAVPIAKDRSSETRQPQPTPSEAEIGVAERTLCEQFGLNPDTLMRHARMRGLSAAEYLHQVTGWVYRDGKYYPGDQ